MRITVGAAEFRDQNGGTERTVCAERARVNIPVTLAGSLQSRKVQRGHSSLWVYEEGRIAVGMRGVHSLAQVNGRPPAAVSARVLSERDVDVESLTSLKAITAKEKRVPIG